MPCYDFSCRKCGSTVEVSLPMDYEHAPLCCNEGCGGIEMEQLISKSNFHLKGLGWAAEGYDKTGANS